MSRNKSSKHSRSGADYKLQPSILRRKRKADNDLEGSSENSQISIDENSQPSAEDYIIQKPANPLVENFPDRVSFTRASHIVRDMDSECKFRPSPLPELRWAKSQEVWESLITKDIAYYRNPRMFSWHPDIKPKMRSILLDWLIEVCEVYKLHRETFYLAQDCIDRYLTKKRNIPKQHLQLLGVTCLFIAAKVEEIYPPKLVDFAYVTDGACTEQEILHQELVILMNLEWSLSPVTACSWLSVFLQISAFREASQPDSFAIQCYSTYEFLQLCQLLDVCILDVTCLRFSYSILAASAVVHIISKQVALSVTGFRWPDIADCVEWMTQFASTVMINGPAELKTFGDIPIWDMHNIQTHNVGLKLLEKMQESSEEDSSDWYSPSYDVELGILTPPHSSSKKVCLQ